MPEKPTKTATKPNAQAPTARSPQSAASDWRIDRLAEVRALAAKACPDAIETVKWRKPSNGMRGVPVWECRGILFTGETYKDKVKLTFARGAALNDPSGLFNASLDGGVRRAIDPCEDSRLNARAFTALVRAAAALNKSQPNKSGKASTPAKRVRRS